MRQLVWLCPGILLLLIFNTSLSAQKQNNTWYFGNKAGLDFNYNPPKSITSDLETLEGTASISDPAGHLLFYTNGATVWDRHHNPMPNGTGLLGGESSTQAALIIPVPGSCDQYYLFATEDHFTNGGLTYSIVDMCLNEGNGDIPSDKKNILLQDATAEKITAILHPNGVDIWIVTHTLGNNNFFAFLVTASGINSPVITSIGADYPTDGHIGPAKASHDGRKIVSAASFRNICEMFDFDKSTGALSNHVDLLPLLPIPRFIYGIEFSPNDSLLYLTSFFVTCRLVQIDLDGLDVITLNSKTGNYHYGMLQIGTDNKIYMARTDESFIDVIHQPNLKGTACQYEEAGITLLPGTISQNGLPNFAPYSFYLDSTNALSLPADVTLCQGQSLALHIADDAGGCIEGLLWSNGSTEASLTINQPGTYWVEVRSTCRSYRDSIDVQVESCPLEGCVSEYGPFIEIPGKILHGYSLAPTKENDGFYLGGLLNDSALLIRYDLQGKIIWSRTFDIVPGLADHISAVLLDSDGMLAVSGTSGQIDNVNGGPIFVFRFDPENDQVLWTKYFVRSSNRNYNWTIIEESPGGNYILSTIPVENSGNINVELFELNRNTGAVMPGIYTNLDLSTSDEITSMVMYEGFLYGNGRFGLDGGTDTYRQALIKIDPADGSIVWSKVGHRPANASARFYGVDLLIENDAIYNLTFGDPNSGSLNNTNLYMQKTSLDGNVSWVKQYQLPGTNDWGYELQKSGNGIVILAIQRAQPYAYYLFKIDFEGNVLWAQEFPLANPFYTGHPLIGDYQMIEVGGELVWTGYEVTTGSETKLLVIRTDLNGNPLGLCTEYNPVNIPVTSVENPVFFDVNMMETEPDFSVQKITMTPNEAILPFDPNCFLSDTLFYTITDTICSGESLEGYTESGLYEDHYITDAGCDSVRILALTVNECGPDCGEVIGSVYGTAGGNEYGYGLAAKPSENGFYVVGRSGDSTLIAEMDLLGNVVWSKKFDVVPDSIEHAGSVIVDTDGNLVVGGSTGNADLGGTMFSFKYNPIAHQLLWAHEYITVLTHERFFSLTENPINGNYILSTNPEDKPGVDNDATLLEVEKNTGSIVLANSRQYSAKSSESINDLLFHEGYIYGTGRYTDGPSPAQMRNTLVKIDPATMHHIWVKLGHVPTSTSARLYAFDLVIENNAIYSGYYGDPNGTSTTNTLMYLQKTSLDGELIWLKQYNLPGSTDWGYELVRSGNGIVVLAQNRTIPRDHFLFQVDLEGNVVWANRYMLPGINASDLYFYGRDQLIRVGNELIFTGFGNYSGQNVEMLVVRTDLKGVVQNPCVQSESIQIAVQSVNNPVFYTVNITEKNPEHTVKDFAPQILNANILPNAECSILVDTIYTYLEATICEGDAFEGYTISGTYEDEFINSLGCDSIRTLVLHVASCNSIVSYDLNSCSSFMNNGSNMDYSEFVPVYPTSPVCATLSATNLFRDPPQENKHSCTPGVNNSIAMCISSLGSCTYVPGHSASLVFELNVVPSPDSTLRISKLEFYERSPNTYSWIAGSSGPNNYPLFYGVRVLVNNVEIFRQTGIGTHQDWTLQTFAFPDIPAFNLTEPTLLRVEFLPYCPIGNGAIVSAWDIDEINLFGGCVFDGSPLAGITGEIKTSKGQPLQGAKISLGDKYWNTSLTTYSDHDGHYHFDNMKKGLKYYMKGYDNNDLLEGVSTLDLLAIQKHLLGIKPLQTLPQIIAGDINHSNHINAMDLIDLRKVLLGMNNSFPNNTSWRIGNCLLLESNRPDDFREVEELGPISTDHVRMDFMAIKIGDLNGDVNAFHHQDIASRSAKQVELIVEEYLLNNEDWYMEVKAVDAFITEGLQLELDLENFELLEVVSGKISLSRDHYAISKENQWRLIWTNNKALKLEKNDVLFGLKLKNTTGTSLISQLSVTKNGLLPESYLEDEISKLNIRGVKTSLQPALSDIIVMPNPFTVSTTIQFVLKKGGIVEFTFMDITGTEIGFVKEYFAPGVQKLNVNSTLSPPGMPVVLCQVRFEEEIFMQKLVRLP